tara:strand:- start:667 stop:873 length:207 start_codon:yes stop_codon:yes gene_type:complete
MVKDRVFESLFVAIILTLVIHFFTLARTSVHVSIQVFFSIILFTLILGALKIFLENRQKGLKGKRKKR